MCFDPQPYDKRMPGLFHPSVGSRERAAPSSRALANRPALPWSESPKLQGFASSLVTPRREPPRGASPQPVAPVTDRCRFFVADSVGDRLRRVKPQADRGSPELAPRNSQSRIVDQPNQHHAACCEENRSNAQICQIPEWECL